MQSRRIKNEMLFYGFHQTQALFKMRKNDIIRVNCTQERLKEFSPLLKWCAQNKKAYHIVTAQDLENISESVHHEGIVVLARSKPLLEEKDLYLAQQKKREPLVILDQVTNPHNVGAIMRVMAHFGFKHLISSAQNPMQLSSSAARVSEGGFEHVSCTFFEDEARFLKQLKKLGYLTVGTVPGAKQSLYGLKIPSRAFAFFLGNEVSGLSKDLIRQLDQSVVIPGTHMVQSLNVAMACGLVMGEYYRQQGPK